MKIPKIPAVLANKIINRIFPFGDVLYSRVFRDLGSINKNPRAESDILSTLIRGVKVLDDLNINYCLGRGTVLGIHRDNKFLEGDIDIDIDVFGDDLAFEIIKSMPFELLLINTSDGRFMQLVFIDDETQVLFDIWFYHVNGSIALHRNYHGYFTFPQKQISAIRLVEFRNQKFRVPEPEWYCRYWYGDSWAKPITYQAHWTINYSRDCKGFKFVRGLDNRTLD